MISFPEEIEFASEERCCKNRDDRRVRPGCGACRRAVASRWPFRHPMVRHEWVLRVNAKPRPTPSSAERPNTTIPLDPERRASFRRHVPCVRFTQMLTFYIDCVSWRRGVLVLFPAVGRAVLAIVKRINLLTIARLQDAFCARRAAVGCGRTTPCICPPSQTLVETLGDGGAQPPRAERFHRNVRETKSSFLCPSFLSFSPTQTVSIVGRGKRKEWKVIIYSPPSNICSLFSASVTHGQLESGRMRTVNSVTNARVLREWISWRVQSDDRSVRDFHHSTPRTACMDCAGVDGTLEDRPIGAGRSASVQFVWYVLVGRFIVSSLGRVNKPAACVHFRKR